jgi:arsenate reductase
MSAGLEPGTINPLVIEVMREEGIDISQNGVNSVFELFKQGRLFQYVITVCDESSGERCPIFPGIINRLHWGFDDPSRFAGNHQEKLEQTRLVRDQIRDKIKAFVESY